MSITSGNDDTPLRSPSLTAERDHFVLKQVSVALQDLNREVKGYRNEAVQANAKLDEHVRACDRRYSEMRDARRGDSPGDGPMHPLVKKVIDKVIDYAVFAVVVLLIFAFKHGASLPMPSP